MATLRTIALAISTVAAATAASPACAQPVTDGQPLAGLRVEGTVGYDSLSGHDQLEGPNDNIPDHLRGTRVGVAAGYDIAVTPALMIGIEVGFGTNISGGISASLGRDALRVEGRRDIDVALRFGAAVRARTLVFAKIGYANSRLGVEWRQSVGNAVEVDRYGDTAAALRLGGGVEQGIGKRLYLKAEYRRTRYGDDVPYQVRTTRHQLLGGIGVRF